MPPPVASAERPSVPILETRDPAVDGGELTPGDPARLAEVATLELRVPQLSEPAELIALATEIDRLAMQLAHEVARSAADTALVASLKPVLLRASAVYGKALLRAAERFDDLGSPRRAVFILVEALRKAFDPQLIASVAAALSFALEANGQEAAATRLREILIERGDRRAAGVDRREIRSQFTSSLEDIRDRLIEWTTLDDDSARFD
jgi:hypothetical protein